MQNVSCVAVDDEPLALALIAHYVSRIPGLTLLQTFEDALAAGEYLRQHPVDLLFADINMPDITGIDLVVSLEKRPALIFTTAYKKYAFEGFELEAVDYLLKPVSFERFERAVKKVFQNRENQYSADTPKEENGIFVWSEYRLVKIPFTDIEYIEARKDYACFHITGSKPLMSLMPLKLVLEKLPSEKFARIHRSFIVPVAAIKQIFRKKILLTSGKEMPIGESYYNTIRSLIRNE